MSGVSPPGTSGPQQFLVQSQGPPQRSDGADIQYGITQYGNRGRPESAVVDAEADVVESLLTLRRYASASTVNERGVEIAPNGQAHAQRNNVEDEPVGAARADAKGGSKNGLQRDGPASNRGLPAMDFKYSGRPALAGCGAEGPTSHAPDQFDRLANPKKRKPGAPDEDPLISNPRRDARPEEFRDGAGAGAPNDGRSLHPGSAAEAATPAAESYARHQGFMPSGNGFMQSGGGRGPGRGRGRGTQGMIAEMMLARLGMGAARPKQSPPLGPQGPGDVAAAPANVAGAAAAGAGIERHSSNAQQGQPSGGGGSGGSTGDVSAPAAKRPHVLARQGSGLTGPAAMAANMASAAGGRAGGGGTGGEDGEPSPRAQTGPGLGQGHGGPGVAARAAEALPDGGPAVTVTGAGAGAPASAPSGPQGPPAGAPVGIKLEQTMEAPEQGAAGGGGGGNGLTGDSPPSGLHRGAPPDIRQRQAATGATDAAAGAVPRRAAPPSPLAQHSETSSDPESPSGRQLPTAQHAQPHRLQQHTQQQQQQHPQHPHPSSPGPGSPAAGGPAAGRGGLFGDVGDLPPAAMALAAAQGNNPVLMSLLQTLVLRQQQQQQQQQQQMQQQQQPGKQPTRGSAPASGPQGLQQLVDRAQHVAAQGHLLADAADGSGSGLEAPSQPAARYSRGLPAERQRSPLSSGPELGPDPRVGPVPGYDPNALASLLAGATDAARGADAGHQGGRSAGPHRAGPPPGGASPTAAAAAAGGGAPLHRQSSYTSRERAQAALVPVMGADAMQLDTRTGAAAAAAAGAALPHRTASDMAEFQSLLKQSGPRLGPVDRPPSEADLPCGGSSTDKGLPFGMGLRAGVPGGDERIPSSLAAIERKLLLQEERLVYELKQVRLMQKLLHVQQMKHLVREAMRSKEREEAPVAEAAVAATGLASLAGGAATGGAAAFRGGAAGPGPGGPSDPSPEVAGALGPLGGAMAEAPEPANLPTRQGLLASLESLPPAALAALLAAMNGCTMLGPREPAALEARRSADPSGPAGGAPSQRDRGGGPGAAIPPLDHPPLPTAPPPPPSRSQQQHQQQHQQGRSRLPPPEAMELEGPGCGAAGGLYDDPYGGYGPAAGFAAGLVQGSRAELLAADAAADAGGPQDVAGAAAAGGANAGRLMSYMAAAISNKGQAPEGPRHAPPAAADPRGSDTSGGSAIAAAALLAHLSAGAAGGCSRRDGPLGVGPADALHGQEGGPPAPPAPAPLHARQNGGGPGAAPQRGSAAARTSQLQQRQLQQHQHQEPAGNPTGGGGAPDVLGPRLSEDEYVLLRRRLLQALLQQQQQQLQQQEEENSGHDLGLGSGPRAGGAGDKGGGPL